MYRNSPATSPARRLNWTKAGLKDTDTNNIRVILNCLNWTKVGLKDKERLECRGILLRFELD